MVRQKSWNLSQSHHPRQPDSVVGPGGAGVIFGGFGERGEAIVWRAAGRGQGVFVDICSMCVLIFPTTRRTVRGAV